MVSLQAGTKVGRVLATLYGCSIRTPSEHRVLILPELMQLGRLACLLFADGAVVALAVEGADASLHVGNEASVVIKNLGAESRPCLGPGGGQSPVVHRRLEKLVT
jgi:hypothetical protein